MKEAGVVLSVQDNASVNARRISDELQGVARSADNINSALDSRVLEEYDRKLTEIGESYSKLQQKQRSQSRTQSQQFQQMVSSAGTSLSQAGRGDVGGAALSAGKGLSGIASLLGGPATLLAGLGLAGGVATNALAGQYEERSNVAGRIAALQGEFATDLEENTRALRSAMASTVKSVSKYGITYEEGAKAQESFLKAGGTDFDRSRAGAFAMAGRGQIGNLAATAGLFQRYGQTGVLDTAENLRRAQGLGVGQYEELLNGIQSAFSSALSRGVIRDPNEIARTQAFMARGGQTFQGALGAQRIEGMNQAVSGAAGLQNQSDLFLYRAAQGLTKGKSLLETKMLMEQGMSPDILKGLIGEFKRFGYGETESVLQLSRMFGLSTREAKNIYGMDLTGVTQEDLAAYGGLPEGTGRRVETEYISDVENLRQAVAGVLGAEAFDLRASVVGATDELLKSISDFFKGPNLDTIKTNEIVVTGRTRGIGQDMTFGQLLDPLTTRARGVTTVSPLLKQIGEAKNSGLSEDQILEAIGPSMKTYTGGGSAGGSRLTGAETSDLSRLLQELIESNKDVAAAVRAPIEVVGPSLGGFTQ